MKRWFMGFALIGLTAAPTTGQPPPTPPSSGESLRATLDPALPSYRPSLSVSGEIRSVGEDYMERLMKLWIDAFTKVHPRAQFTVEAKGSKTAVPALAEGRSDIGPMGRELFPDEGADFWRKHGYRPFAVRVAGGTYGTYGKTFATAFFVNKENPIGRLSLAQLDAMYSKTRKRGYKKDIRTWGQLGLQGEWANRPINLYGIKRPDGTVNYLQWRILEGGEWKDTIKEFPASLPMVFSVAQDPAGIGYARFGQVNLNVKTVALAEKDGGPYYKGTLEEVVSHRYPMSRYVYIIVNRPPGRSLDPKVKEFLTFVLSKEGQEAVQKEGDYLPLSARVVNEERSRLERRDAPADLAQDRAVGPYQEVRKGRFHTPGR